jgi:hypothetical protein
MKRRTGKHMAGIAILSMALCGCQPDRTVAINRLREICRSFAFISPDQLEIAEGVRERIRTGEIDPWHDLTFRSGPQNSGEYSEPDGILEEFEGLVIQHMDIYEKGEIKLHMKVPVYRAQNSPISLSAPEYVPISCSSVDNKPLHKYI